ncbi:DUF2218 domain-containing protein [Acinetobacter baumannii]|uniref:DUF2218 domain-containing protein n=1 Tax=Acinetobacter baumannii TaxID=470 RepID=UPI0024B64E69|nr:DUF2218 domain-containing protein [Acinetobacter baumannii]MDI9756968.1 DUF2218 domain-containing protein [Acinetobacter baumannii]
MKSLCNKAVNHWKHKFEVQETEQDFKILMPTATITLAPETEQLNVAIDSQLDDHDHLEKVVLDHLNRMAQQEFQVQWQH